MSSDKIKKELKELLKDPDNKYCADCPIKGPTWASVNIGVWICMPCSGIHRSLGTHITQVRSADLDKWKPEWVEVMREWGNAKANAVWEAKMPKGYEGRPNESEAQELTTKMQKFIKDKYERKKWYSEKAMSKKKKEESESEEEEEEEEEEIKPKKKPVVVMKSTPVVPALVQKQVTKSIPVEKPETLLDDFNPFDDDSSFTPFSSAPTVISAPAISVNPPATKPAIDLMSLYASGSQQSWGQSAFTYPGTPFPSNASQSFPQQTAQGNMQFAGGATSFSSQAFVPPVTQNTQSTFGFQQQFHHPQQQMQMQFPANQTMNYPQNMMNGQVPAAYPAQQQTFSGFTAPAQPLSAGSQPTHSFGHPTSMNSGDLSKTSDPFSGLM